MPDISTSIAIAELWYTVAYKNAALCQIIKQGLFQELETNLVAEWEKTISEKLRKEFSQIEFEGTFGEIQDRELDQDSHLVRGIIFPEICLNLENVNLRIQTTIEPGSNKNQSMRLISVPRFTSEQLTTENCTKFFLGAKAYTSTITEIIGERFFSTCSNLYKLEVPDDFSTLDKYHLFIYVIGGKARFFKKIIECSNDENKMHDVIHEFPELRSCLSILESVNPEVNSASYKWFREVEKRAGRTENYEGMYGFVEETNSEGNFVGLVYGDPHEVTKQLLSEILAEV